jgi:hypothetical protein
VWYIVQFFVPGQYIHAIGRLPTIFRRARGDLRNNMHHIDTEYAQEWLTATTAFRA